MNVQVREIKIFKGGLMSMVKRFLEDVSVDIGFSGEINDEVIRTAEKYFRNHISAVEIYNNVSKHQDLLVLLQEEKLKCKDHGEVLDYDNFAGFFEGNPVCHEAWKERETFLDEASCVPEELEPVVEEKDTY